MSSYREFRAPTALAGPLVCLWQQQVGGEAHTQAVLPDGCVDIVWVGDTPPLVAGPATRRMDVALPAGTLVTGLRFRPGRAGAALGLPADLLRDQAVPLAELWGREAQPFADVAARHAGPRARLGEAAALLARRLLDEPMPDPLLAFAVAWLARHPAGRVSELARQVGLSDRQLQRRFCAAVGYGPKVLQRILRFQHLLAAGPLPLAELAGTLGYADQAHMCREVRALAGQSPQAVLRQAGSTLALADLFADDGGAGPAPSALAAAVQRV